MNAYRRWNPSFPKFFIECSTVELVHSQLPRNNNLKLCKGKQCNFKFICFINILSISCPTDVLAKSLSCISLKKY